MKTKSCSFLVLDDDPGVVDYLVDMLRQKGYAAIGHADSEAALKAIEKEAFDLVISDVVMPGMRGQELMATIHQLRPEQLVLLMTAFGSIDLVRQCLQARACGFLTKPFRIEELYAAVERSLHDRQMRRTAVKIGVNQALINTDAFVTQSASMK